ncbi:hypothetical protein ABEO98_21680 [Brevibacillus parabrevis]|uniref:hypothetical protein n=1 Tax=Brevibacillus parabrevis TaxID=54914 RepID=UPI002E1B53BD|nr:hypothetical protein [Brevibacillus parabrevis]
MSSIRVANYKLPFTQIELEIAENSKIKWSSRGLLLYLLSRPPGWTIRKTDLIKRSPEGKDVVESALLDLMLNGYIFYYADREENGQVKEWVYEVYRDPESNPHREEGKKKAQELLDARKNRNKKKNDKRKNPETDNPLLGSGTQKSPETGYPKVDDPKVDDQKVDNPPFNYNQLNYIDLKKEEDMKGKEAQAPLSSSQIEAIEILKKNAANDLPAEMLAELLADIEKVNFYFDYEDIRQASIVAFDKLRKGEVSYKFSSYFITILKEKRMQRQVLMSQEQTRFEIHQ